MEYVMLNADKRRQAAARIRPTPTAWTAVLSRAGDACEWASGGTRCGFAEGAIDPIGGGTVHLTPDHLTPHEIDPNSDPSDPDHWQALCGRHQVIKKNFWDDRSGNLNVYAIRSTALVGCGRRAAIHARTPVGDVHMIAKGVRREVAARRWFKLEVPEAVDSPHQRRRV